MAELSDLSSQAHEFSVFTSETFKFRQVNLGALRLRLRKLGAQFLELNAALDVAKAAMGLHELVRLARVPATRGGEGGRRTETGLVLLLG